MEFIKSIFGCINDLGNYAIIPIMITIAGLTVRLKFSKALRAGVTVGIGLIDLDMIPNLLWIYISPVVNIFVEEPNLNLNTVDIDWFAATGLAFSATVGSFIVPFTTLVNIIPLVLKLTRTISIDIWNYWHYALSGAVAYTLTDNLIRAFVASVAHYVTVLAVTDYTVKAVQSVLGVPGTSVPQGRAVTMVPIYKALDKVYDLVLPKKVDKEADSSGLMNRFGFLKILVEPLLLELIIGILLSILVDYDSESYLTVDMAMAALTHPPPRTIKVIMEGLYPTGEQTREFMQNWFRGEEFYIGMDSTILLGFLTTVSVALLLIPITLVLAMVLPINTTLPLGDLVSTAYFISMTIPIYKNGFDHIPISGTIMMGIVLHAVSFFAPMTTQFAATGTLAIPEGAVQVAALSAGSLIGFILCQLSKFHLLGSTIVVALTGGVIYFFKKLAKKGS